MGFGVWAWHPADCRYANLVSARTSENQLRFSCLEVSVLRRRPTTTSSSYHPRFSKPQKWAVDRKSAPTILPIYDLAAAPASCSIIRNATTTLKFATSPILHLERMQFQVAANRRSTLGNDNYIAFLSGGRTERIGGVNSRKRPDAESSNMFAPTVRSTSSASARPRTGSWTSCPVPMLPRRRPVPTSSATACLSSSSSVTV